MSFWMYKKDKDRKSFVYSVNIPIEMLIIIMGITATLLSTRYIGNSVQIVKDALALSFIGFFLFAISKVSLFRCGIWNSWGPKQMNKPFRTIYKLGYTLMAIGLIGCLIGSI